MSVAAQAMAACAGAAAIAMVASVRLESIILSFIVCSL